MAKRKRKRGRPLGRLVGLLLIVLVLLVMVVPLMEAPEGNPYTAEDFAWQDGRMQYLNGEALHGIDVSYYQQAVDWEQVKASGIDFVFVRVGYRSTSDGTIYPDEMAEKNLAGAKEAGLKVGAYFFSQALNPAEALEEAHFALSMVKDCKLDLPLAYDWEFYSKEARTNDMDSETLMNCIQAFCTAVELAGHDSMVYFNRDLSQRMLDVERLGSRNIWFAMYDSYPDAPCKPDYWQYSDEGSVPGIDGPVDLNLYFPE